MRQISSLAEGEKEEEEEEEEEEGLCSVVSRFS